ncbi:uncharacterized mitochondrial protein-like protein [Tanacetum coccineum]
MILTTRIVEENLYIRFSESTPNAVGSGLDWLFDIDALTRTMNYEPIVVGTQSNGFAGTKASDNTGQARKETEPDPKSSHDDGSKPLSDDGKKVDEDPRKDNEFNAVGGKTSIKLPFDPNMSVLEDYSMFYFSINNEDDGAMDDMNNLDTTIQEEPKMVIHALKDPSWIEAIQEELLQFKNKKDERGITIRNKAGLVAQGYTQEEGIDYDEVFALVARIEAISLFLAYASFKDFVVYQIDVKSVFLYGKIEEEVYMSSMGELTFFLGLQVKQKKNGIFISQDKYVEEILKKFRFTKIKTASTPMETQKPLFKDEDGKEVDVQMYRSMIGSLLYLTSSRPDIMFAMCVCARYQVNPNVSHLHAMKRIFRYLKGQPKLGILYPKDSPFDLVAYTDSDYAGASLDRKSTIGGCQFLRCRLISWQCKKQTVVANSTTKAEYVAASSCYGQVLWIQNQLLNYGLVRAATTASSLEVEQDSGNITKTRSNATPNESSSLGTTLGGGPRCQETMGDTIAQTRFENVSKHSNDSLLARGNTLRSDEYRLKLNELMKQNRVLDLEKTKTTQQNKIDSLKRRVKKLEKKRSLRTYKLKRQYKVGLIARVESSGDEEDLGKDASKQGRRINAIDADEDITLGNVQDDANNEMFDANVLDGKEVFVAGKNENVVEEVVDTAQVSTAATTVTITTKEITLVQALEALKTSKPKVKGIVFQKPSTTTTTITTISSQQSQDKGKGIMIEKPVKPMKKKVQIMLDEEAALKLQAEFEEEERLAREKAKKEKEANIALIEEWDDIQAKIDVDHQLAKRSQAQEQEELSDAEKATLFQQLLEKRRKHFAAKRAEERRNKPPTKLNRDK